MSPRLRQLLWFVALWILGVAAVGTVAFIIRLILMP
ncbi:MAG: DUF2474 domain-containing protein [Sneathiella sp.]|jgi:preprotein translocase subunit Sss1|nr:DUF2474 domain-containing protein [Sneathiella sp.]